MLCCRSATRYVVEKYLSLTRPLDRGNTVEFAIPQPQKMPSYTDLRKLTRDLILTATLCNLENLHNNWFCCRGDRLRRMQQWNNKFRPMCERRHHRCSPVTKRTRGLRYQIRCEGNTLAISHCSSPRNGETNYNIPGVAVCYVTARPVQSASYIPGTRKPTSLQTWNQTQTIFISVNRPRLDYVSSSMQQRLRSFRNKQKIKLSLTAPASRGTEGPC